MDKDFKASDLLKDETLKKKIKKKNYKLQYQKCIETIKTTNDICFKQFTVFAVPLSILGEPNFDSAECIIYLMEELEKAEFYARIMKPGNLLFISWREEDVKKVKRKNEKKKQLEEEHRKLRKAERERVRLELERNKPKEKVIEFNPDTNLGRLHLATTLMKDNTERFGHLKTIRKHALKKTTKG